MTSDSPEVRIVASGRIDRYDRCANCDKPMYYRLDDAGNVAASLCVNMLECAAALLEAPQ